MQNRELHFCGSLPLQEVLWWAFVWAVLAASAPVIHSQPLTIYTLAGHPAGGSAVGPGRTARFSNPSGVAADGSGNLYIADTQNSAIRKITPEGLVSTFAGIPGSSGSSDGAGVEAKFYAPQGLAADAAGFIYVADTGNSTIRKISPTGVVSTLAGLAGYHNSFDGFGTNAHFDHPGALAVDAGGTVYVADTWNHTIRKITPAGQVTTLAGLAGNPGSADGANARFNRPAGITFDATTNIFVCDFLNHTLRRVTPAGSVSTIAGLQGVWGDADGTNSVARFYHPHGIVADPTGNLYVMDSGNHVVRKISRFGTNWVVSKVAGLAGNAGNMDDTGNAARFYFPAGLAIDGAGHLFFADLGNNTIRTDQVVTPLLQLSVQGSELVISWPASAGGFVLETIGSLSLGAQWMELTNNISTQGENLVMTTQLSRASAFYRLRRQ
jgi:sugar lactone lactonase YvrE